MNVNGVSNTNGANATSQIKQMNNNGTIEISFKGKKTTVSKADSERFLETFNYVNYVAQRIAELEEAKVNGLDDDEKAELANLRSTLAKQRETTSLEISADGRNVVFSLKKDINVEEFKKLFYIDDSGAFREHLKDEALNDGRNHYDEGARIELSKVGEPYVSWTDAWMNGITKFENGVKLAETPDGKFFPDYTGATLKAGTEISINVSYIDPPNKPWYQFW